MFTPPQGSRITLEREDGHWVITIPPESATPPLARIGSAIFLTIWLIGWTAGGGFAMFALSTMPGEFAWFLVIWLIFWAFALVMVVRALIGLLRPASAASFVVGPQNVLYDRGHDPKSVFAGGRTGSRQTGPRRRTLDKRALHTLHIDTLGTRLTMEFDGEREEIAPSVTIAERRWLHDLLSRL